MSAGVQAVPDDVGTQAIPDSAGIQTVPDYAGIQTVPDCGVLKGNPDPEKGVGICVAMEMLMPPLPSTTALRLHPSPPPQHSAVRNALPTLGTIVPMVGGGRCPLARFVWLVGCPPTPLPPRQLS